MKSDAVWRIQIFSKLNDLGVAVVLWYDSVYRLLPPIANKYRAVVAQSQLANDSALVGSWEGPLVLGRDNMNLAFTFAMKCGSSIVASASPRSW